MPFGSLRTPVPLAHATTPPSNNACACGLFTLYLVTCKSPDDAVWMKVKLPCVAPCLPGGELGSPEEDAPSAGNFFRLEPLSPRKAALVDHYDV